MKTVSRVAVLAVGLSSFISMPGAETPTEVCGIVLDSRDGQAMPGVAIQLEGQPDEIRSDAFGRFTIRKVDAGQHLLQVSAVGFWSTHTGFRIGTGETKVFEVTLVPKFVEETEDGSPTNVTSPRRGE